MDEPGDDQGITRRFRRVGAWGIVLLTLGLLYGPSLMTHMKLGVHPLRFTDDVRQHIPPYIRDHDPELLQEDYVSAYLRAIRPVGFRALYAVGSRVMDPRLLSDLLLYLLYLCLLIALGAGVYRAGGLLAVWAVCALALSSAFFLERMTGGLPRGFAPPLVAAMAAALLTGRIRPAAALVVLSAAFYPSVGIAAGIALSVILLLPRSERGEADAWNLTKRLSVIGATALASVMLLLPALAANRQFGPLVYTAADVATYVEAGPQGRLHPVDRMTYHTPVWREIGYYLNHAFRNEGRVFSASPRAWTMDGSASFQKQAHRFQRFLLIVCGVILVGMTGWAILESSGRRLLIYTCCGAVAYQLSILFKPLLFLPQRHLYYFIPVLMLLWFVLALCLPMRVLGRGDPRSQALAVRPGFRAACILLPVTFALLLTGGRIESNDGFKPNYRGDALRMLTFIATLPGDAIIAGWPTGPVNDVPQVSGHRVLISDETHLAWHRQYMDEMRRRMTAVIEACFATDEIPLERLRDTFGVTHLIVNERHFSDRPPRYFVPFQEQADAAAARMQGRSPTVIAIRDRAEVFSAGGYFVLDLAKISDDTYGEGSQSAATEFPPSSGGYIRNDHERDD